MSYYFQGKDNITFHSQIWPAELLGYAGKGDKGGEPGTYGVLNLPTEVVASEFMTLEGKQFSTSRKHVIYVQDIVARYGPDPIRYFICAAGPENQDADFSWAEFVQRNNSELVAGWGNLVNRTAAMIAKSFGEIPQPYAVEPVDEELLGTVRGGLRHRRRLAASGTARRRRSAEVMRIVGEANAYVAKTEPFKLKGDDERERLATVLHTLAQAVSDINTLDLTVLAARRQPGARGARRASASSCRCRVLEVVADLDDDVRTYPVITGDYSGTPRWERRPVVVGTPIAKPTGVFVKLDPSRSSRTSAPGSATPLRGAPVTTPTRSRTRRWLRRSTPTARAGRRLDAPGTDEAPSA